MAFGTARDKRTKNIEPGDLIFGERGMVTVGIEIVAAIQRNQRAFESSDGSVELVQRDIAFAKGLRKERPIGAVGIECFQQLRRRIAHLKGRVERPLHLFLETGL